MSSDDATRSDAPATTFVKQHDLAQEAAEMLGWDEAAVVGRSITVNKPRQEVYDFWRDFRNFPTFMENVRAVSVDDDRRSHWAIAAPGGETVEWDSLITEDAPGEVITWESEEGADIKNTGRITFHDAPPGRGTIVTATIVYDPPAGRLGQLIAKLFQREPKLQARRDLRRFKQMLETGEIATARTHPET
jgi:uncharacterized membrane protein